MVEKPRRWNIRFIRNFMITFGLISSIFDYLTFGVLLFLLKAQPEQFRSGWFIESVISASLIVLVIRTRQPFFKSRPSKYLSLATLLVTGVTLLFPYTPLGGLFGFQPPPFYFLLILAVIMGMYIFTAEAAKKIFYRRVI
jgi:P-type Mg2+ transporter